MRVLVVGGVTTTVYGSTALTVTAGGVTTVVSVTATTPVTVSVMGVKIETMMVQETVLERGGALSYY
jgi:hypothetical protein